MWHQKWLAYPLLTIAMAVRISSGRQRTWAEEYPGPWQQDVDSADFRAIVKTLMAHNVRGCGEFFYRPSAHHSHEYLVYCTRDGKVWRAYQVWTRINEVLGPQEASRHLPLPYEPPALGKTSPTPLPRRTI